jgi:hypothetical protein
MFSNIVFGIVLYVCYLVMTLRKWLLCCNNEVYSKSISLAGGPDLTGLSNVGQVRAEFKTTFTCTSNRIPECSTPGC